MHALTVGRLRELLNYDPDTGAFAWRVDHGRKGRVGVVPGHVSNQGYGVIYIDARRYLSHRLAWLYVYGDWPADQLDHINGIRTDNRLSNLRPATKAQNAQNLHGERVGNTSGITGVSWDKQNRKWRASITNNYKVINLGRYDTKEEAGEAYRCAKAACHPFAARQRHAA